MIQPRLAVLSAWNADYSPLAELTIPNRKAWCERWGYELVTSDHWEVGRHPYWAKWKLAMDRLADFDWVFMWDVDAVVANPERNLNDFLGPANLFLLATVDIHGLNAGAVLLKNTSWTKSLLEKVWNAEPYYRRYPNPEQSALAHLLYAEPKYRWEVLPQRCFNSYRYGEYGLAWPEGEYQEGDMVLHLPGLSLARRLEIVRGVLSKGTE